MMSRLWFRTLLQHLAIVLAGAGVGWLYDRLIWGLLGAIGVLLLWHVYNLFLLERWLTTGERGPLPSGDGPWSQVLARVQAVNDRARENRRAWVRLVKELRASTKAFPDGGVILNKDMEIVRSNKVARSLLGLKKKRDRGTRIENLIRHPEFIHYLETGSKKRSVEIPAPTDNDVWLSCRVIPYGMDQKLLLVRDISESVKMAKMRRDFAANASHELRSPLTVIAGYLDVMAEDENLPEAWVGPVEDMREQSVRMRRLVDDLLQLTRLESAESCPRDKRVDVESLLQSVRRDALAQRDRPRTIELDIESTRGILGEETDLQSVVTNLVNNAVRYTPHEGSVLIGWRTDDKGGQIWVKDTGIGISDDDLPRITERFYRTSAARARQEGGTGLGLAIVKHALKRHDAELIIESKLGSGSQFTCRFPKERIAAS
ncbi:MAG: phosphate regulon sensor histidine kinase PhoR [Gammaproteobacteria bacterium]|nr:phosphate regulon sensor histidine kinase PhoR [Gammaproteobacteria bacterium]